MKKCSIVLLIAGMLAVCSLVGCGKSGGADSDWYKQVLSDAELTSQYSYYRTVDVNQDGVPALFLSTTEKSFVGAEDKGCMIVNVSGEPKTIKEIGGAGGESFYYNEEEKTLTYFSRLSGESHLEVCELKDGELTVIKTIDYYAPNHAHDEETNPEMVYRVDGADVSEDEYNQLWDTYAGDDDAITYEKIQ